MTYLVGKQIATRGEQYNELAGTLIKYLEDSE
jgi:hypothetical protein